MTDPVERSVKTAEEWARELFPYPSIGRLESALKSFSAQAVLKERDANIRELFKWNINLGVREKIVEAIYERERKSE